MKALFNRLRYPKTDAGRRCYVRDSLRPKYQIKIISIILIVAGIGGTILSLVWCFESKDFNGSWLFAILSLLLIVAGILGIENKDESRSISQQEIDEMIERKKRRESHD
jgi:hypothetical protein